MRYENAFNSKTFKEMSDRNNYEAQKAFKIFKKQHIVFLDVDYKPMTEQLVEWEDMVNAVIKGECYEDAPSDFNDSAFWEDFASCIAYISIPEPTEEVFTALNTLEIVVLDEQAIPLEISEKSMVLKAVDNRYLEDCCEQWVDITKYSKDLKKVLKGGKVK